MKEKGERGTTRKNERVTDAWDKMAKWRYAEREKEKEREREREREREKERESSTKGKKFRIH